MSVCSATVGYTLYIIWSPRVYSVKPHVICYGKWRCDFGLVTAQCVTWLACFTLTLPVLLVNSGYPPVFWNASKSRAISTSYVIWPCTIKPEEWIGPVCSLLLDMLVFVSCCSQGIVNSEQNYIGSIDLSGINWLENHVCLGVLFGCETNRIFKYGP